MDNDLRLGDFVEINPNKPIIDKDTIVSFVPMVAVSENAQLQEYEMKHYSEIGNGFTFFAKNDILVAKITPCFENGKGCYLNNLKTLYGFGSTEFIVLRAVNIDSKYLFYITTSYNFRKRLENEMSGSAGQKRVSTLSIIHCPLSILPPLPEQQKIAEILSTWDDAIEKQTAIIEKLALRKRGLMQQLLSCQSQSNSCKGGPCGRPKKRLSGFSGEWKEVRLGDVAKVIMGQSPDSNYYNENKEGFPLIQGNADINDRKTIQRIWTTQFPKVCNADDIIMTVRAPVGFIGVASEYSCLGRGVCALQPYNIDKSYFYQLMIYNESKWKSIEQGGIFSAVGSEDIIHCSLSIIHSLEKQTAIAAVLTAADNEISLAKQKLESLRAQKKGLMQVLLTGKKRVKN